MFMWTLTGAGCVKTRKSTTGMAIVHGGHLIRSFSKTRSNIALSSAEAELYAMVSAASEGMGARAMVKDYGGGNIEVNLFVDASASIEVAHRKGLGRIRHLDTQSLWIQDAVRQRKVALNEIQGAQHPADMMTTFLGSQYLMAMMDRLGLESVDGRSSLAPQVAVDDGRKLDVGEPYEEDIDSFLVSDVCSLEIEGAGFVLGDVCREGLGEVERACIPQVSSDSSAWATGLRDPQVSPGAVEARRAGRARTGLRPLLDLHQPALPPPPSPRRRREDRRVESCQCSLSTMRPMTDGAVSSVIESEAAKDGLDDGIFGCGDMAMWEGNGVLGLRREESAPGDGACVVETQMALEFGYADEERERSIE